MGMRSAEGGHRAVTLVLRCICRIQWTSRITHLLGVPLCKHSAALLERILLRFNDYCLPSPCSLHPSFERVNQRAHDVA